MCPTPGWGHSSVYRGLQARIGTAVYKQVLRKCPVDFHMDILNARDGRAFGGTVFPVPPGT